ncbi:DUF427 domain-containing protein [Saccharospirillum impatiens]|uniref:DUF427 domain-containing protein n=1 Tax=Saccharospirillum impatiens TaxID=169438 RepID=UPI0003FC7B6C|nr:DUF427 domain-containing protein [Saccharospirillum impatiens]
MIHNPESRITLQPHSARVTVRLGDEVIAETDQAVQLSETGYPDRQYLPSDAIVEGTLRRSDTQTYCPFKGHATYYNYVYGDRVIKDSVWVYEHPTDAMTAIAGRMVFDPAHFDETIETTQ